MKKTRFLWIVSLAIVALVLAACPPAETPAPVDEPPVVEEPPVEEPTPEPVEEVEVPPDVITIQFWHAMSARLGEETQKVVDLFNESQDRIFVEATFQGSYEDNYNALLASFEVGGEPHVIQNFDLAAQTMIDTGRIVPAWRLMQEAGVDPGTFEPAVVDYYSDEQGMVAMPFNSSNPIIYFNAEMFEAAGVEPPGAEAWTFSELLAKCDALLEAGVAPYCLSFGTVGWYFEQILANSGGLYFNNDNGRTARATEAVFNSELGVQVFDFLTGLIANGYAPNFGSSWTEPRSTFIAGQTAMHMDSTAAVTTLVDGAGDDFTVSTAFIPNADGTERNGVIIGGAALWLIDGHPQEELEAAWEFMQFLASPEAQIVWHTGTGYFPTNRAAYDLPELIQFWEENPNLRTAVEQLRTTVTTLPDGTPNYAVRGGMAGPFPTIRQFVVRAYSRVLNDGLSAQQALDEAAALATEELQNYAAFFE